MRKSLVLGLLVLLGACGGKPTTTQSTNGSGITAGKIAKSGTGLTAAQIDAIIQRVKSVNTGSATASAPRSAGGTSLQTMNQFVTVVIQDVSNFWAQAFRGADIPYQAPVYVVMEGGAIPRKPNCNGPAADADSGPFYCPAGGETPRFGNVTNTGVLYFGAPWLYRTMSTVNPSNFDFAVASVVAHEFGHHVQALLAKQGLANLDNPNIPEFREISADCLSGVWANAAYQQGELQDTDVQEATQAAWNAGDTAVDLGPDPHGSPQERANAFMLGYNTGDPVKCVT